IFLVRHAEKLYDSDETYIPLSKDGQARAEALARLLKDAGITAIYSTQTVRTLSTVRPLSLALQLKVTVADQRNADGLVARIRKQNAKDIVLVVGHANTVPEILRALGYPEEVRIAANEFDNLFVVLPNGSNPPTVLRLRY
ncbi:MAG: SixA phosphatase family protein, partial [Terriglobales bacterium]